MNNTVYNVYDIDFTRALPEPLKNDENILALGRAIAGELQENIHLSRFAIIYARLDELEENVLDILASDLHIDWYEDTYPIETKRQVIKDSVKVHKRLGTKYAVESIVRAYFGSGEVREWFEYGGNPHHFKIISGNPSLTNERIKQFFEMLETVKRKSSWLDAILITLTGEMTLYMGVAVKETNREAHIMGSQDSINRYYGTMLDERTAEAHIMGGDDTARVYMGMLLDERETEVHIMGANNTARVYLGVLLDERTAEAHAMDGGLYERVNETYAIKEESN